MKHIKNLKNSKTDEEKWRYIINLSKEEKKNLIIMLDNDQTIITEKDSDHYVSFNNYIGQSMGIHILLEVLNISYRNF